MTQTMTTNRLINEKSPYLLQHAHNPVDWYPWGEDAFAKAAAEDKPVFLSIGYSTCHWCHVMERESFEDPQVAALLNESFVAVKVDREERPDIDEVYMTVCQAVTGSGGWPLTIIMTPDKQPFFAATYVPAESRFGQMGLHELLPRLTAYWREEREEALGLAGRIREALTQEQPAARAVEPGEPLLRQAFEALLARYDSVRGGFGRAPKFPSPHNLSLLLRHWQRTGDERALQMVGHTLQAMHRGGIWDHIGFGLHRYSTDAHWLVPHFEKMLYDQALLTLACLETYQATEDLAYEDFARETLAYVLRDMTSPEGGFYSAEDADSEGVEGKFYVWTEGEVRQALPADLADLVVEIYNINAEGNFEAEAGGAPVGANILHRSEPLEVVAARRGVMIADLRADLERARALLLARRNERVRPLRDDKVLADWNGLMIAAFARAGWVLDEPVYLQAAARAAEFILAHMRDEQGRLLHRYRDGEAAIAGFLDDYAFMAWGLVELYEASFEPQYLRHARDLADHALAHFRNPETGAFAFSAEYHEQLFVQREQAYDGAVPSGNSVMLLNLLRLSRLLGAPGYEQRAGELTRALAAHVAESPAAHAQFLIGLDMALTPGHEVLICGGTEAERTALLGVLRREFLPHAVLLVLTADMRQELAALARWVEAYRADAQPAAAYVCTGRTCQAPVTTPGELNEWLSG